MPLPVQVLKPTGGNCRTKKTIKEHKQPKFIPYEPYKAATNPIIPEQKQLKQTKISKGAIKMKETVRTDNIARVAPLQKTLPMDDHIRELEQLRKEKKELEKQLNIQSKVNTDLKRLLVASVGEDLEARVHFLTEDKVKLAHDVHHYVQRLLDDHEEMEKLSIQCDVWRSKFLASSLVVDELANWKAVLYHRYDEALETLNNLLDEQMKTCEQLQNSYRSLKAIQMNVEPLANQEHHQPDSIKSLSTEIEKLSSSLHLLLGNSDKTFQDTPNVNLSPAQAKAQKMVSESRKCFHAIGCHLSAKGIAQRFHPNARYEYLTMNCCSHCSGEIKLL